jgi:hypothetical protein
MSEVAELLGISKTTMQNHAERGLASLGSDFVVLQHQIWDEETQSLVRTLWVGTIE